MSQEYEKNMFAPRDNHIREDNGARAGFQKQAADLLTDPASASVFKAGQEATKADELVGLQLTESRAHQMSHDNTALSASNGDQVETIARTSPTHESVEAMANKNVSLTVEMCSQNAEMLSAAEHNDDLPDSFRRELRLKQYGAEA
jgi:hypothetical protein